MGRKKKELPLEKPNLIESRTKSEFSLGQSVDRYVHLKSEISHKAKVQKALIRFS